MYRLVRINPLSVTRLQTIDKLGVIPHQPKRSLIFKEEETNKCFETTDLNLKILARNKKLKRLYDFYKGHIEAKRVSILLYTVNIKRISSISSHLKDFKRKFKKHCVPLLATYWQRDVGDKIFEPHLHVIFILSRINYTLFSEMFPVNPFPKCNGKIILGKTFKIFLNYLGEKDIFSPKGKRSNFISRKLLHP